MFTLKGFVTIDELVSNVIGATANHGELSTYASTFSREKGYYNTDAFRNMQLISFMSKRDNVSVVVTSEIYTHILTVMSWILAESKTGTITSVQSEFIQALLTQYPTVMNTVTAGTMGQTNTFWLPEWLEWTYAGTETCKIRIWLSDSAFRSQYDEYAITVIPPTAAVDQLIGTATDVRARVQSRDLATTMSLVRAASGTDPSTLVVTENYYWVDPSDTTVTFATPWTLVIYGAAGNNPDVIKAAIKNYITANSAQLATVWGNYMPDVFKTTEFILAPLWTQYSVPNLQLETGVYSPWVDYATVLDTAKKAAYSYDASHIASYMTTFSMMYNSLVVLGIGSDENRDNIYNLSAKFPDYMCVPSTDADFNRMSTVTQDWVLLMLQLAEIAETLTAYSDVAVGFTRITRNGIIYAAVSYKDVQYLMVTKASMEALMA